MSACQAAEGTQDVTLTFPPDPVWVRSAREVVRTVLTAKVPAKRELIDVAALLTSEAVTNAVRASEASSTAAPIAFSADWGPDGTIHIAVQDHAPGLPEVVTDSPDWGQESGRGMYLISSYAQEWGVRQDAPGKGKAVWFTL
ncbi:hypothetical protein GCM10009716_14830 [Streptomyces sodiiphilus]|uniref:Histidine kinase/HSP90-like ATPase domain-containing protein n=1 Tax=Streptomyces sodiiphilus TaxID=226217 RepID=A0ABP5A7M1_9ACTN